MTLKLKEPAQIAIIIIIKPMDTSYETIWAVERKAPKKAYLELLDQPDIIIP